MACRSCPAPRCAQNPRRNPVAEDGCAVGDHRHGKIDQLDGLGPREPIPTGIADGHDTAAGSRQPRLAAIRSSTLTTSA